MQFTVNQLLTMVHEAVAGYPSSLAYNHARRKLGSATGLVLSSGLGAAIVEIPVQLEAESKRVVPTQDFGIGSQQPSVKKDEKSVVEDAPKKAPSPPRRTRRTRAKTATK